jgi:TatD DNase family protein
MSRAPRDLQQSVFRSALAIASEHFIAVSVHSTGAIDAVLDEIDSSHAEFVILHWWAGNRAQTDRAIKLGCFFSINGAVSATLVERLPRDRVLTETDYPFTARQDPRAISPGAVYSAEAMLATAWSEDISSVRTAVWQNLGAVDSGANRIRKALTSGPHQVIEQPAVC